MHGREERKKSILNQDISFGVSMIDLVMTAKHLAVMLEAGMTIPDALSTLKDQSSGSLKATLKRVQTRVLSGSTFGDALAMEPRIFSPVFVSAVVIGESSGTLAENLIRLSMQMEKDLRLRRQIQSASLYPVIILSAALLLGLGIATFVLPKVVSVFYSLNTQLPLTTRVLIWVAKVFDRFGLWLSGGILLGAFSFVVLVRQKFMHPITHRILLALPAIKTFIHDSNRARFCRTLGTLLESGTPIVESLHIVQYVTSNVVYQKAIEDITKQVATGDTFSSAVEHHEALFSTMIARMAAVGEESGRLGTTFSYLAQYYEDRIDALSKNFSSVIEPVLLVLIGLLVGLIAVSVITPIYSITSSITI